MKVEVFRSVAGRRWSYPPGVHEVPEDIAQMLLDAGQAKKVSKGGGKKKQEPVNGGSDDVEHGTE